MRIRSKYKLKELNKLISTGNRISILYSSEIYTVERFVKLKPGEDYYDPDDGEELSGIAAYVEEIPSWIPYECIEKFFISIPIEVS